MKKSVLVCIPCLLTGGTEMQTLNLVRALKEADYEVTTVCYFEHSSSIVEAYQNAGSKVICLSAQSSRPKGIWRTIAFLYNGFSKLLKTTRFDIVHVQYMAPGAIPIILLRLLGCKEIIATAHTCADIYPNLRLIHFLQKHVLRAFTCISLTAEKSFFGKASLFNKETIIGKRNHFSIYNALSPNIPIRQAPRQFEEPLTIGVVSRLEHIKGMDLVIPAFEQVHSSFPATRLLIVGDGSLRTLMEQQATSIQDVVTFVGRQPADQLCAFYDKIDILWIPSRSEGFGLTALEGMARGCVVVSSKVGGLTEVVSPQYAVEKHNLSTRCMSLVKDKEHLQSISKANIERASEFSFPLYASQIDSLYSSL